MLAWRNLVHDKVRLAVTVTGIIFAVVLIVVAARPFPRLHDRHLEPDRPFGRRSVGHVAKRSLHRAGRAVHRAEAGDRARDAGCSGGRQVHRPLRAMEAAGRPPGERADCRRRSRSPGWARRGISSPARSPTCASRTPIFVDEIYRNKLGVDRLGQVVEIRGRRARVAGFTRGIRAFTTSPYVFTTFKNALDYAGMREDQTLYHAGQGEAGRGHRELCASR